MSNIKHPKHYKTLTLEPFLVAVLNQLPYLDATALKYLLRWRNKGGVEDLQKAIRVIEMMIWVEQHQFSIAAISKAMRKLSDFTDSPLLDMRQAFDAALEIKEIENQ